MLNIGYCHGNQEQSNHNKFTPRHCSAFATNLVLSLDSQLVFSKRRACAVRSVIDATPSHNCQKPIATKLNLIMNILKINHNNKVFVLYDCWFLQTETQTNSSPLIKAVWCYKYRSFLSNLDYLVFSIFPGWWERYYIAEIIQSQPFCPFCLGTALFAAPAVQIIGPLGNNDIGMT